MITRLFLLVAIAATDLIDTLRSVHSFPSLTPRAFTSKLCTLPSSTSNSYLDSLSRDFPADSVLQIKQMTWDGVPITKNAYIIDLPKNLLTELRAYADRMGITDMYHGLVMDGQPLPQGGERPVKFNGYNWMIQRPKSHWKSNMHWTSPADEDAHDDYLRVLSDGGFDEVLQKVGSYFDLDALSAYHLSFIGVSHCQKGFVHADVNNSGRKAFNMIIPLHLQQDEGGELMEKHPELEIVSDDETVTKLYKYEYHTASMVGDGALHATAQTEGRGMRMAATVYIGDITPTNVNHLLMSLTQAYPPVGDAKHLLDRAGSHWCKLNPLKRLPSNDGKKVAGVVTIP